MAIERTPPAWRRVFLRELGRSGSVALAADTCGIDRSSAYQLRGRHAAFARSWDRAQEAARKRLGEASAPPEEGQLKPSELRGDETIRASKAGRPCIVRAGPGRWSAEGERAFLAELTATANVAAAARAAGVSTQAAYNRRRLWPAFAEAWREALAAGYVRIETLLIHAATATLDPEPTPETASEAPPMTVDQALNLFKLHRASQHGGKPQRYAWRQQEPDIEEVRAEILRKVAAMERAAKPDCAD